MHMLRHTMWKAHITCDMRVQIYIMIYYVGIIYGMRVHIDIMTCDMKVDIHIITCGVVMTCSVRVHLYITKYDLTIRECIVNSTIGYINNSYICVFRFIRLLSYSNASIIMHLYDMIYNMGVYVNVIKM